MIITFDTGPPYTLLNYYRGNLDLIDALWRFLFARYTLIFLFVLQVNLCHSTKHWIVPTNARAVLFVRSFSVTYLIKFRLETEKKRENKQISQLISFLT